MVGIDRLKAELMLAFAEGVSWGSRRAVQTLRTGRTPDMDEMRQAAELYAEQSRALRERIERGHE